MITAAAPQRHGLTVAAFVLALAADAASKAWANTSEPLLLFGPLLIHPVENPGFAFSTGASALPTLFVVAVRALALVALLWALVRLVPVPSSTRSALGRGLLLAGGAGNLLDYALGRGGVTDFFGFVLPGEGYAVMMNVADLAVFAGIALALADVLYVVRRFTRPDGMLGDGGAAPLR
jgi:lipoprotein signal peptidase